MATRLIEREQCVLYVPVTTAADVLFYGSFCPLPLL